MPFVTRSTALVIVFWRTPEDVRLGLWPCFPFVRNLGLTVFVQVRGTLPTCRRGASTLPFNSTSSPCSVACTAEQL